jgi:hypothetical protein
MRIASNQIPAILRSASAWSRRLQSESESPAALIALVERVELAPGGFRLSLKLPIQLAHTADAANHASLAVSRFIHMQLKRRVSSCGS